MKTSHRAGRFRGGWIKEHIRTQNRRCLRKGGCGIPTEAHAIMGWWLSQFYSCLLLFESPGLLVIGEIREPGIQVKIYQSAVPMA